jgi:hypothetical protein
MLVLTRAREPGPVPVGPSLAKAQAREPRHEIELPDRGVADPDRVQADPALADDDMVALGALRDRIMGRYLEPDLVDTRFERRDTLTAVEPRHVRHECLDHEDAIGVRCLATAWKHMT